MMRGTIVLAAAAFAAAGCATAAGAPATVTSTPAEASPILPDLSPPPSDAPSSPPTATATAPPAWLGTRVLEVGPDGSVAAERTPPELRDRRLTTVDVLPPPGPAGFRSTVDAVPDDVLARSTWDPACPVGRDALRYVTVTFVGFDGRPHTGELLIHADAVDDAVAVFGALYAAAFPIEEMRVVAREELDAAPTGDGNNTTGFVCRPTRGSSTWSEHAYGRAIDINPFHNPYVKGDVVLPELATAYVDRHDLRAGMLMPDDVAVAAFEAAGWGWGGRWISLKDHMHFSVSGR